MTGHFHDSTLCNGTAYRRRRPTPGQLLKAGVAIIDASEFVLRCVKMRRVGTGRIPGRETGPAPLSMFALRVRLND